VILKRLVVGPFASNCYIVGYEATKEGMIIDPGAEADQIIKSVTELGLKIKLIILTHGHIDHIGGVAEVKGATRAELAMHHDDVKHLQNRDLPAMYGLSYPTPPPPDRLLNDGDSIDIGELHFEVIHTPGHSGGCISLFGNGVLFSGDTLFNYGIGRYDLPDSDYNQLVNSLTRLMTLPDETIVFPGHGPDTTISAERQGNPFLRY